MATPSDIVIDENTWSRLVDKFPELHVDAVPTIDGMVVDFLRSHEVYVAPVSSGINPSRGTQALVGAIGGPMAAAANQAITTQNKTAALQEWTSWKQWTLNHKDWATFKSDFEERYRQKLDIATKRFADQDVQDYLVTVLQKKKKDAKRSLIIWSSLIGGYALMMGIIYIVTHRPGFHQPARDEAPASTSTSYG